MAHSWPGLALFLLGAYHGLNPAMGWLFSVALGLQERSRRAVWRALPPIALGHAISIAWVVGFVVALEAWLPERALRIGAASAILAFGVLKLWRSSHPRWVGMQVGFGDLTLWSFLMASGHGAGLMLVPFILRGRQTPMPEHHHMHMLPSMPIEPMSVLSAPGAWLVPVGLHTSGYIIVTAVIAVLVYEKLGLKLLGQMWLNLDMIWAIALIAAGVATLLL